MLVKPAVMRQGPMRQAPNGLSHAPRGPPGHRCRCVLIVPAKGTGAAPCLARPSCTEQSLNPHPPPPGPTRRLPPLPAAPRDIKPHIIILSEADKRLKLIDLGACVGAQRGGLRGLSGWRLEGCARRRSSPPGVGGVTRVALLAGRGGGYPERAPSASRHCRYVGIGSCTPACCLPSPPARTGEAVAAFRHPPCPRPPCHRRPARRHQLHPARVYSGSPILPAGAGARAAGVYFLQSTGQPDARRAVGGPGRWRAAVGARPRGARVGARVGVGVVAVTRRRGGRFASRAGAACPPWFTCACTQVHITHTHTHTRAHSPRSLCCPPTAPTYPRT
mgnify:CR=1 FL=1